MKNKFSKLLNILLIGLIILFIGKKIYLSPKQKTGEQAPDFSVALIGGNQWQLSDHKNDYVLLDFWAPWCGPCRKENPELVKLFDKYREVVFPFGGKFIVLNIALENNREKWMAAIEKDKLNWPNHAIEKSSFDGPVTALYKVKEIPRKYLIGPGGEIVLVNPDVDELDDYLSKYAKNK